MVWGRAGAILMVTVAMLAQASDYQRGVALCHKGEYREAVPLLVRAGDAAPKDAEVWKALGVAYAAQRMYAEALPAFRRACLLNAALENACYFEARALYGLDQFEASLQVLEYAEHAGMRSAEIELGKAQALEALGRAPEAETEFRSAIASGGDATDYGVFLIRQGRTAEAIEILEKAVAHRPSSAETQMTLGRALLESGKVADAIPRLERAVALQPDSSQAHLLLAKAYVRAGRPGDAAAHFQKAKND